MFNPSVRSLLAQTHVEELQRAAHAFHRGRNVNRPPAAPLSGLLKRAIHRAFPAGSDEAASLHGFELAGDSSAATLRPRS